MTTDDILVDGRPVRTRHDVHPAQVGEIARATRPIACARCGGPAPPGSVLVSMHSRNFVAAWRQCQECRAVDKAGPHALVSDVYLAHGHTDPSAEMWQDTIALRRAVDHSPPPLFAYSTTPPPDPLSPALPARWAFTSAASWIDRFPGVVQQYARTPSPKGTPCPRCGRARDHVWRQTDVVDQTVPSTYVCSTCPTGEWDRLASREVKPSPGTVAGCRARGERIPDSEPWSSYDQEAARVAGIPTGRQIPGLSRGSGWFPPSQHPQWPHFPSEWGPHDYLPEGVGESIRQRAQAILDPPPVTPAATWGRGVRGVHP